MRAKRSTWSYCWVLAAVAMVQLASPSPSPSPSPPMTTVFAFCPRSAQVWAASLSRSGDGEGTYSYRSSRSSKIWKKQKQKRPAATPASSYTGQHQQRRPNIPLSTLAYVSATEANVRIGPTSSTAVVPTTVTEHNHRSNKKKVNKDKGLGAYAMTSIRNGDLVGEYQGEILTRQEVEARYWELRKRKPQDRRWVKSRLERNVGMTGDYLFDMDDDLFIDGADAFVSGWCRFMNHAHENSTGCNVETKSTKQIWNGTHYLPPRLYFWAIRDIEVGEELSYDYGDEYWD